MKQGRSQILSFRMSMVNDAYLFGHDVLEDAFKLLGDCLLNPLVKNQQFVDKIVNEEKRLLADKFDALYDNKISYALDQLMTNMFKDESFKIRSLGEKADLEAINSKNLYETYQQMINEDVVDLYIIGNVEPERVQHLVATYLPLKTSSQDYPVLDLEEKQITKVETIFETQDIAQAKLNIGLRTHTRGLEPDYDDLLVLNGILGGYPHSLLFKRVREEHSLCYYIASTIDRAKGAMFIYAGIAPKDYELAKNLTLEQIDAIKKGEFSDEILENTKNALINDLLEMNDDPNAVLATYFGSRLYGEIFDIDKRIQSIKQVTKENVVKVAQKLELDTIYCLTSKEGVNANE